MQTPSHPVSQEPADVAVVIPTVLRPQLLRAVRSVFRQDIGGRLHLLIGVDAPLGDASLLDCVRQECPSHVGLTLVDPGYSTSSRHGGLYPNRYSGALRTILSYMANSRYVAYLDDDDWWLPEHLSGLRRAIAGKEWAFSYRWLVDPATGWPICRDEWDSVGPGRGVNAERFGGFVSPSNLMLDKMACHAVLPLWAQAAFKDGTGEDRLVFAELLQKSWAPSALYTCFYELSAEAQTHVHHAREFAARNVMWLRDRNLVDAVIRGGVKAEELLQQGETAAALECVMAVLQLNPYHVPALKCLAIVYNRMGQREATDGVLAQIMAIDAFADRPQSAV